MAKRKRNFRVEDPHTYALGTCCICGSSEAVRTFVCLNKKCSVPGTGWGCVVCGIKADGAMAVICDACCDSVADVLGALRFVIRGYPSNQGREPIGAVSGTHEHNMGYHKEELSGQEG